MNEESLKNKTALISGASRGIGRALALALAQRGVHLILLARTEPELQSLAAEVEKHGVKSWVFVADASNFDDVARVEKKLASEKVVIDIIINNVGVGKYGNLDAFSVSDYDWIMDSNMKSTFLITRAFAPAMKERGRGNIVFIASVAGLKGLPGEAIYCASKNAQVAFAQSLDYEMRPKGVKVNVIAPGGVKTHFALGTGRAKGDAQLDKMLDPGDVVDATLFALCQSEKSRVFLVGLRPMSEPL